MYSNVGRKIQNLSMTIGVLGVFISIGVWIYVWVKGGSNHHGVAGFFLGIALAVVILIAVWISTWLAYGFGVLVENSEEQTRCLKALAFPGEKDGSKSKAAEAGAAKATAVKEAAAKETTAKADAAKAVKSEAPTGPADYFCNKCGFRGPYDALCPKCGSAVRAYALPFDSRCISDEKKKEVHFFKPKAGMVICPKCGIKQPAGNFCPSCGYAFTYDE